MDQLTNNFHNVSVTHQAGSLHNDDISESDVDNQSIVAVDMSQSIDIKLEILPEKPMVYPNVYPEIPPMVNVQKKKTEERQVIHRKTGKIGVGNLRRRRALSVWADSRAEYYRDMGETRNRSKSEHHTLQAPTYVSSTIVQRSASITRERPNPIGTNNQMTPSTVMVVSDSGGVASSSNNKKRGQEEQGEEEEEEQQQQHQSQQQQLQQELVRLLNTKTFCVICQTQYASLEGLRRHQKTQKHKKSLETMDSARQHILDLAYAQFNANRANP